MTKSALVAGASGIVGNTLARHIATAGWQVHGLARKPSTDDPGVALVSAGLMDPAALTAALAGLRPTCRMQCGGPGPPDTPPSSPG